MISPVGLAILNYNDFGNAAQIHAPTPPNQGDENHSEAAFGDFPRNEMLLVYTNFI